MDYIQLGKRIKTIREICNFSQAEVAKRIGVTQTYIFRLENGKGSSGDLTVKVLSFYSQFISLDRLFDENCILSDVIQEDLKSVTNEVVRKRAALVRESVNDLIDKCREELDDTIKDMQQRFNAKMDSLK